jgi:hypothetical protein
MIYLSVVQNLDQYVEKIIKIMNMNVMHVLLEYQYMLFENVMEYKILIESL